MRRIVPIDSVQQIGMLADGLVPTLPAEEFSSHAPDLHLAAIEHGIIAGRLSLWWKHPPTLKGEKVGAIGHYLVADAAAGQQLIEEACRVVAASGIKRVLAPIDGSAWRAHAYITEPGTRPPFFLERQNPPQYPQHFRDAGFEPLLTWSSREQDLPRPADPAARGRAAIRPIELSAFDMELEAVHALLTHESRHALLHSPLSKHAFLARHRRSRCITNADLTLMAEDAGKLVGFVFAVPDLLQAERGVAVDTLVVKNLATTAGRDSAAILQRLLHELYANAHKRGLARVIHAFVPDDDSRGREGEVIRRYSLFARHCN